MDESYVIRAVCERIEDKGCSVTQFLNTKQRGVDVKATHSKEGDEFFIEAKGGTSSRVGSARFGKPYTSSQVFDRAAKGVFTCLQLRSQNSDRTCQHVILAVPDNKLFHGYLQPLLKDLKSAGIEVWFMSPPTLNKRLQIDAVESRN